MIMNRWTSKVASYKWFPASDHGEAFLTSSWWMVQLQVTKIERMKRTMVCLITGLNISKSWLGICVLSNKASFKPINRPIIFERCSENPFRTNSIGMRWSWDRHPCLIMVKCNKLVLHLFHMRRQGIFYVWLFAKYW